MQDIFKEKWITEMVNKIKLCNPNDDIKQIVEFVTKMYNKNFKDSKCRIYNNYEKEEVNTTINSVINWLYVKKPILTESGSLFKQHDQCFNPNTTILNSKLKERNVAKKEKFKYMNLSNSEIDLDKKSEYYELFKKKDLKQSRLKVIANSEYGVSGLPSSWFFNMACASATTSRGQALISTAFNAFEDFLSDSVTFDNMDECLMFIDNIIGEKSIRDKNDNKWVNNKTIDDVFERLYLKFTNAEDCDIKIIKNILSNLDQENLNRIFYKSNMYEFFRNSKKAKQLLKNIVQCPKKFMDPKKPNDYIKNDLDKLRSAIIEYVHYNYQFVNRVTRLKTRKRKSVVVIDTDSNFINLGPWVNFVKYEILSGYKKISKRKEIGGRNIIDSRNKFNKIDYINNEQEIFRIINTMANVIDEMINRVLKDFLRRCNVPDDNPGNTSMKNEFLYPRILISYGKKHYQAVIRLQEGNLLPYEMGINMDIKGMEYMKPAFAGVETRNFIQKLIYDDILTCEGAPDNVKILRKLNKFEDSITKSILNGESKYLKTANIKTPDAYADPMSTGSYKAAYVWNYLYPDKQIEFPGIAYIIPINLQKPKDFAQLSVTDPELFNKLMDLFEDNDRIKKSGITNIAIPLDETIPKSLEGYINFNDIISKNLSLIIPVLNCIGIKSINKTKDSMFFSNIVEL